MRLRFSACVAAALAALLITIACSGKDAGAPEANARDVTATATTQPAGGTPGPQQHVDLDTVVREDQPAPPLSEDLPHFQTTPGWHQLAGQAGGITQFVALDQVIPDELPYNCALIDGQWKCEQVQTGGPCILDLKSDGTWGCMETEAKSAPPTQAVMCASPLPGAPITGYFVYTEPETWVGEDPDGNPVRIGFDDPPDEIELKVQDGEVISAYATYQFAGLSSTASEHTTLQYLPEGCFHLRPFSGTGPEMRRIEHVVATLDLEYDVTIEASAGGWTPGVPMQVYVRVEHNSPYPACPYGFGLTLPDFWKLQNGQGASVEVIGPVDDSSEGVQRTYQNLWWTVVLEPGEAFERWVTVVPGEPPAGVSSVTLWAGQSIQPFVHSGPDNAKLVLPLVPEGEKLPAGDKLPPVQSPTDTVKPTGCPVSGAEGTPRIERVVMSADPPVMKQDNGYRTTVTATLVDVPGKPAESAAPLRLEVVSSGGVLSDIKQDGVTTSGVLTIRDGLDERPRELLVKATAADGATGFLVVGIDAFLLRGQVVRRPGDGTDQPVYGATVVVGPVNGGRHEYGATDAEGRYEIPVWTEEPFTVRVSSDTYLTTELPEPPPPADSESVVTVPDMVAVPQDALVLAQSRASDAHSLHQALLTGGLVGQILPAPVLPDPTADGGSMMSFFGRVSADTKRPDYSEEALRRLTLALDVANLGSRDAADYAEQIASAIYDDGVGMVTELVSTVTNLKEFASFKVNALAPGSQQHQKWADALDLQIKPRELDVKKYLSETLSASLDRLLGGAVPFGSTESAAGAIVDKIFGAATDQARQNLAEYSALDPDVEQAALDALFNAGAETIHREAKAAIAGVLARTYLEMVYEELATATEAASAGAPSGFPEGSYEDAHRRVRAQMNILETTRHQVSFTPGDEALKEFVLGVVKDYRDWGKAAIIAVTAGHAIPVLAKIEPAISLTTSILHASRFIKGLELMEETLTPDSIFWQTVQNGIRVAFYRGG